MLLWHQGQWYNAACQVQDDVLHRLCTMTSANFMDYTLVEKFRNYMEVCNSYDGTEQLG